MPETTLVADSQVGDAWIRQVVAAQPCRPHNEKGDYMSGPVRLTFPHIFEREKPKEPGKEGKYRTVMLFPPNADLTPLRAGVNEQLAEHFAHKYNATAQTYMGVGVPFRDQGERVTGPKPYAGYTTGQVFASASSNYKPQVVDGANNPVTDPASVYPGVWAIVNFQIYAVTNVPENPCITFTINSLMLIGDDKRLGGGPPDAQKTFASVAGTLTPLPWVRTRCPQALSLTPVVLCHKATRLGTLRPDHGQLYVRACKGLSRISTLRHAASLTSRPRGSTAMWRTLRLPFGVWRTVSARKALCPCGVPLTPTLQTCWTTSAQVGRWDATMPPLSGTYGTECCCPCTPTGLKWPPPSKTARCPVRLPLHTRRPSISWRTLLALNWRRDQKGKNTDAAHGASAQNVA